MNDSVLNPANFDRLLRLAVIVALLLACFQILAPFLGAIVWGAIIAVTLFPVFRRLTGWLRGRRGWAATLVALLLFGVVVVPLVLVGTSVASGVEWAIEHKFDIQNLTQTPPPEWLAGIPVIGPRLNFLWLRASANFGEFANQLMPYVKDATIWLLKRGTVAGAALLQLVIAIFVAAVLLARHEDAGGVARGFSFRVGGERGGQLLDLAARTVRSVSLGVIGSAFAQAVLSAIGFAVSGVPGVGALGFLTFLVAVIQLPTLLVWVPAAIWLYYNGETGWAVALALWGLLVINTIDNVLRPLLISQGAKLPLILIFIGVIGGLLAWGFLGLFIGPTILAVCYTLFGTWLEDGAPPDAEVAAGAPPPSEPSTEPQIEPPAEPPAAAV
jgi:predicted PurR-regulated permease PerM